MLSFTTGSVTKEGYLRRALNKIDLNNKYILNCGKCNSEVLSKKEVEEYLRRYNNKLK
jgi:hypothetical protein